MRNAANPNATRHPLAMNSFRHWLRLLRWGGGVDRRYWRRALFVTCLSPFSSVERLHERLVYGRRLRAWRLDEPPVFIIGHWRSGTTHLHNLLSHDPNLGYVTTFQTQAPKAFLVGRRTMQPIMAARMPTKRPMDNLPLGADLPQEEEFCLCNACMHSFYLWHYFPRQAEPLFRKYLLFEGVKEHEFEEWRKEYLELVRKAALHMGGKRLVLKNPANTARTGAVLRVFPGAKFIHIYRNPYAVYTSMLHLIATLHPMFAFQELDESRTEQLILDHYRDLMQAYFANKDAIPTGQLSEVRYEDLERRPLEELRRVYGELGLPGWETAQGSIAAYLATVKGYEKNAYTLAAADRAKVEAYWAFALERLGYPQGGLGG